MAQSTEEVKALLAEGGAEMSDEEAELIHTLARQILDPANRELSLDELQAVAGGVTDRDWDKDGCAATVEDGSSCWFTDGGCVAVNISYKHKPVQFCFNCGAYGMIHDDSVFVERVEPYVEMYREYLHCHYCGFKFDFLNRKEWF